MDVNEMLNPVTPDSAKLAEVRPLDELALRIRERRATIGVVGLGYVGLPLAVEFAHNFPRVIALDLDRERVEAINARKSHVRDVSSAVVADLVDRKRLQSTFNFSMLAECDAVIMCVPTPLEKNKDPNLEYITRATEQIAANLRPGQLVVLESTSYPGTTEELVLPILQSSGSQLDDDFLLAFSPERIDPGSTFALRDIPKVVGGCSEQSTDVACELYASIINGVHRVSSARVAETVKLLENTFRLVNIGLVNEFAMLCSHLAIDSHEVIEAAATKPFGFMPFFPGPGAGGHCIPLDPIYLAWKAKQQGFIPRFIELADEINTRMPAHVVDVVTKALNTRAKALRDSHILIVGVAYKDNVEDVRHSPAVTVIDRLRGSGAFVAYHDDGVSSLKFNFSDTPEWRPRAAERAERRSLRVADGHSPSLRRRYDVLQNVALTPAVLEKADCVIILNKHRGVDYDMIADHASLIVDTRYAINAQQRERSKADIFDL